MTRKRKSLLSHLINAAFRWPRGGPVVDRRGGVRPRLYWSFGNRRKKAPRPSIQLGRDQLQDQAYPSIIETGRDAWKK